MLITLLTLSAAWAQSFTVSVGSEVASAGYGEVTRNGNTIGDRYLYAQTGDSIHGAIEIGNGRFGGIVMTSSSLARNSEDGPYNYQSIVIGGAVHNDKWGAYLGFGSPFGETVLDMESDSSSTVRVGLNHKLIDCDPFDALIGVDLYQNNYRYPLDFEINHAGAGLVLTVAHTSKK